MEVALPRTLNLLFPFQHLQRASSQAKNVINQTTRLAAAGL